MFLEAGCVDARQKINAKLQYYLFLLASHARPEEVKTCPRSPSWLELWQSLCSHEGDLDQQWSQPRAESPL